MSVARRELLERLVILKECLGEANLSDGPPTEHLRNQIAGMMRQGLAVLEFAALEAFIRQRTAECIRSFNPSRISFSDLSDAIQDAATVGAARGLLFRYKFEDQTTRQAWALRQLKYIASSDASLTNLSELSFGNDKANIDEEDISQILKSFGVDKPWASITSVAKKAGIGGLLDSKAQFTQIKKTRHASAHELGAGVTHHDLSNGIQSIRGLAIGFDMLLSHAVSIHNTGTIPGKPPAPKINDSNINILFVAELSSHSGSYEIYRMRAATASSPEAKIQFKKYSSKSAALADAENESRLNREQVVEVGPGGLVFDWQTWQAT